MFSGGGWWQMMFRVREQCEQKLGGTTALWGICKCYEAGVWSEETSGRDMAQAVLTLLSSSPEGCGDPAGLCTSFPILPHVPALLTQSSHLPLGLHSEGVREASGPVSGDGGFLGLNFQPLLWATVRCHAISTDTVSLEVRV